MTDFLMLAFIFLVAGVIAVPIASRLGLGSVLGYLIAGILISPVLALVGVDVITIQHFAEFGVVMMLFLVGLELEPKLLWAMRARLIGLGGGQVVLTTLAVMAVAMALGLVRCLGDWFGHGVVVNDHSPANAKRKRSNEKRRRAIQL